MFNVYNAVKYSFLKEIIKYKNMLYKYLSLCNSFCAFSSLSDKS